MPRLSPPPEQEQEQEQEQRGFTKARRGEGLRRRALPSAAELYVSRLPGLDDESTSSLYAGNLPSTVPSNPPNPETDSDAHLYFLLATNKHIPHRERLVIWLNGGPGCSSFDGALMEVGPIRIPSVTPLKAVEVQNTAWNEYANVLFLDQPAGTGYSYVTVHDDVRELGPAADQVVIFLSNLYKIFPEFQTMDTYIAGESYAGQYIPYIADAILKTTLITPPLKGLLIGNGWISPKDQYPAYLEYLESRKLVAKGSEAHTQLVQKVDQCKAEMARMEKANPDGKGMVLIGKCEEILGVINSVTMKDGLCLNSYNTTQYRYCGKEWPDQLTEVTAYLNRDDVRKSLHAGKSGKWTQCSGTVGSHFWTPNSIPSVLLLPKLLDKLPILLFSGENDLMCAGTGVENMISNLTWGGEKGFGDAPQEEWTVDSVPAGTWTTARGLTYVNFYNASHMVPIDKPVAAHDMLLRFMQVDTLHAAGAAAQVPSRIGKETEAVLGVTQPDGTTLETLTDAESDAEVKDITEDGFDKDHELIYGPRRTAALFVLLLAVMAAVWAFFRWRERRRRSRYRRMKGKGRRQSNVRMTSSEAEAGRRERVVTPVPDEPLETTKVFDVGEDDEYEDAASLGGR
ncbi:carboxypeptidase D [Pseudohyphozyma bogoriensis]|nr:carboxypeptidase D [Pseudohyphozyma bogoriensis]